MRIGIVGGAGKVGRAVFNEATRRGDVPTAIVRDQDRAHGVLGDYGNYLVKDALALTASDLAAFDAVVDAMSPLPAEAARRVELAKRLVGLAREHGRPRLVFVLEAGSLRLPDGRLLLDELYDTPGTASWIANAEQAHRQWKFLTGVDDVEWTGVVPSIDLVRGPAGRPVLGADDVPYGPAGGSRVTTGTLAAAILDELHAPRHVRTRFTVRDEDC